MSDPKAALAAYKTGQWCGECRFGVVEEPPCCTIAAVVGVPEPTPADYNQLDHDAMRRGIRPIPDFAAAVPTPEPTDEQRDSLIRLIAAELYGSDVQAGEWAHTSEIVRVVMDAGWHLSGPVGDDPTAEKRIERTVFVPGAIGEMEAGHGLTPTIIEYRLRYWRDQGYEPVLMERTITTGPWVLAGPDKETP